MVVNIYRIVIIICKIVVNIYKIVESICKMVLNICKMVVSIYKIVVNICKMVVNIYRMVVNINKMVVIICEMMVNIHNLKWIAFHDMIKVIMIISCSNYLSEIYKGTTHIDQLSTSYLHSPSNVSLGSSWECWISLKYGDRLFRLDYSMNGYYY